MPVRSVVPPGTGSGQEENSQRDERGSSGIAIKCRVRHRSSLCLTLEGRAKERPSICYIDNLSAKVVTHDAQVYQSAVGRSGRLRQRHHERRPAGLAGDGDRAAHDARRSPWRSTGQARFLPARTSSTNRLCRTARIRARRAPVRFPCRSRSHAIHNRQPLPRLQEQSRRQVACDAAR